MATRKATVSRKTRETDIVFSLTLDGAGEAEVDCGVPFLNHMLELFAKHGFFDLSVKAVGDLEVDYHHTFEDLGLVFGEAIAKALGDKTGVRRYGFFTLPMDEALVTVALDLSGRPYLVYDVVPPADRVKDIDCRLFHEFFRALVNRAGMNLHIRMISAGEAHHLFEAVFKAFAKALDMAVGLDPRVKGRLTTKGVLD